MVAMPSQAVIQGAEGTRQVVAVRVVVTEKELTSFLGNKNADKQTGSFGVNRRLHRAYRTILRGSRYATHNLWR